jgi:hypothetical protein
MNEQASEDSSNVITYRPARHPLSVSPPAHALLEQCVTDLKQDWDTRPQWFWKEVVSALRSLSVAIDTRLLCTEGNSERNDLFVTQERIDEVGILVTAHAKARRVSLEERLRERHRILLHLQELLASLNEIKTDHQE